MLGFPQLACSGVSLKLPTVTVFPDDHNRLDNTKREGAKTRVGLIYCYDS